MAATLAGKAALVAGSNSGIGEATVHRLAREGAGVAILARRQKEGGAVEQVVRAAGGEALFIVYDVIERSTVEATVSQSAARYGGLHHTSSNNPCRLVGKNDDA